MITLPKKLCALLTCSFQLMLNINRGKRQNNSKCQTTFVGGNCIVISKSVSWPLMWMGYLEVLCGEGGALSAPKMKFLKML